MPLSWRGLGKGATLEQIAMVIVVGLIVVVVVVEARP